MIILAETEELKNLRLKRDKLMNYRQEINDAFQMNLEEIHKNCVSSYLEEYGEYNEKIINGIKYAFDFISKERVN